VRHTADNEFNDDDCKRGGECKVYEVEVPAFSTKRAKTMVSVHELEGADGIFDHRHNAEDTGNYTENHGVLNTSVPHGVE